MIQASVIIATYNRADRLRNCLQALARQSQPADEFEVIVVVDGSTDATREMLQSLQTPFALHVICQPNRGQSAAFNNGAAQARAPVLIFLDDDITPCPDFIGAHLRLHREQEGVVGIGQLSLTLPPNSDWFARRFDSEWQKHYELLNAGKASATWQDCYCGNLSVTRAALERAGGFSDLPRGNDIELGYRLEQQGLVMAYVPGALGDQDQQKQFTALVRDSERSGTGCVEIYRRHPETLVPLLGRFTEQRPHMAAILRLLVWANIPPQTLGPFGGLIDSATGSSMPYHILQRYAYWRGVRHALAKPEHWQNITGGIPILTYHSFAAAGERASRYRIPIARFARQMAWLKRAGYRILSLEELACYRREHGIPPARSVVITIDDGYADTFDLAYPILLKYGFPATIFLVSERVGIVNTWDQEGELAGRALLSWENVREMQKAGMQFGAHTRTHVDLTRVPPETARIEIGGSHRDLEGKLAARVRVFAYPYGSQNAAVEEMLEQAGFLASCGIRNGLNALSTPVQALRRVEITGNDSLAHFALAVRFGARGQALWKRIVPMTE